MAANDWEVDIITMSFGFSKRIDEIDDAIVSAYSKKVIMFAAAANHGGNADIAYPASKQGFVFCINATDGEGTPAGFNPPHGPNLDNYSTLGIAVESTWKISPKPSSVDCVRRMSGTSMATPIAAGIAALVLEFARCNVTQIGDSECTRLHSYDGIRTMFEEMKADVKFYKYLAPWRLLSEQDTSIQALCGFISWKLGKI